MRSMDEKPTPLTDDELAVEFRQILANMEVWLQFGSTSNYEKEPSHGGDVTSGKPSGDSEPPQDFWRQEWHRRGDKRKVWEEAWDDLHSMLKQKQIVVKEETKAERDARMIKDGEGWGIKDIEYHFKMNGKEIRAARTQAGRMAETGLRPVRGREDLENLDYARFLAENGLSERAIEELVKIPKTTLRRALGRT